MPVRMSRSPFERAAQEGLTNPTGNPTTEKREPGRPLANEEGAWIPNFLSGLLEGESITGACRSAGVHPTTVYQRRREDAAFAKAWEEAAVVGTDLLEQEAARRAYHGTLKPVFQKGECVGAIREYSDTLMIFLLKARKPNVYREGVEDGVRNMVVNINVETVEKKGDVIEVISVDSNSQQDGAGVPEAAQLPRIESAS